MGLPNQVTLGLVASFVIGVTVGVLFGMLDSFESI